MSTRILSSHFVVIVTDLAGLRSTEGHIVRLGGKMAGVGVLRGLVVEVREELEPIGLRDLVVGVHFEMSFTY